MVAHLTRTGQAVTLIARDYRPGLPDQEVLAVAEREDRILITDDRDCGELVFRHRSPHAGVIYFRLSTTLLDVRIARVDAALRHYRDELKQFLVVTD